MISLGGVMNQLLLFFIFRYLRNLNYINLYTFQLFRRLNFSILLFNILPLYPLDGYIIFNSILNIGLPYLKSSIISLIISFFCLLGFIIVSFNLKINNFFVISFLIYKVYGHLKDYKFYKNKFILERIMYDIPYKVIVYKKNYSPYYLGLNKYYYFNYQNEKKVLKNEYNNHL